MNFAARGLLVTIAVVSWHGGAYGAENCPRPEDNRGLGRQAAEVVCVTARRQGESAERVPISLTAISQYRLEASDTTNLLKLNQLVPSLQLLSFNPRNTSISIRGLGSNIAIVNDGMDSGVGVYIDGVFQARPALGLFDIPDLASIEVLRGPQGTLYGKNSVAGAININTLMPSSEFEASAFASIGDYGFRKYGGTVSGPLDSAGRWSARMSAIASERDGFFTNTTTGQKQQDHNAYSFRGQLLFRGSNFSLRTIADYGSYQALSPIRAIAGVVTHLANGDPVPRNFNDRAAAANYDPLTTPLYARITDANSPVASRMAKGGLSAEANWALPNMIVTSITAYRMWQWRPQNDDDLTKLSILTQSQWGNDQEQASQEFRVATTDDRKVSFSFGVHAFWEGLSGNGRQFYGADAPLWVTGISNNLSRAALDGFGITVRSRLNTYSYAAYGQAIWHVSPKFDVTGGMRYTHETKAGKFDQTITGAPLDRFSEAELESINRARARATDFKFDENTSNRLLGGLVSLSYQILPETMVYTTYSHGEKSAGINLSVVADNLPKVVKPESVDNYEIGFKTALPDFPLRLSADVFWTQASNYQTTLSLQNGPGSYLSNIPSVRSRGVEFDLDATLASGLDVYLRAAYTDAIYESYPNAPGPFETYLWGASALTPISADLSNRALPAVSKWAFSTGFEYSRGVHDWGFGDFFLYIGIDESFRSGYFTHASLTIHSYIPGYDITNLRVGLRRPDRSWDLQFWARNLFDRDYKITQAPLVFNTGALSAILGDPRTIGATLTMRY